jgi:hypothetical protein
MRYFLLRDKENLTVFLSEDLETQPKNSLPITVNEPMFACFDKYPNPTKLVEGIEPIIKNEI